MALDVGKYLEENEQRQKKFTDPYNPIQGVGSLVPRFEFRIKRDTIPIFLPVTLQEKYGEFECLEQYWLSNGITENAARKELHESRLKEDFEFWAYVCVKIKPKVEEDKPDKRMDLVPFKLRHPQRKLLKIMEEMRVAGEPIRVIIVKARQWGGSTLVQTYMAWIQLIHKKHWHSVIVAEVDDQARKVRSMYDTLLSNYPLDNLKLSGFQNSTTTKQIIKRGCIISIGSMQHPNALRSGDIAMAHLTEVGLWKKTEGRKPEDLTQTIRGSVPLEDYSLFVMESTAKGAGNFFHREYKAAVKGKSKMKPLFVPWFDIDIYRKQFKTTKEKLDLIKSLTEYELKLWNLGATLEGINWYRDLVADWSSDLTESWRLQAEFPATDLEAFQSTGRRVFPPKIVETIRKTVKQPELVGDVFPEEKGEEALKDVTFFERANGNLKVWKFPNEDPDIERGQRMLNRYVVSVDIGGKSPQSDFSVISVFDRYWMLENGVPERAATWRGHIDADLLGWKCAQIAQMYDNALLVIEANVLNKRESDTEGSHFETIVDEVSNYYENMYCRTPIDQIKLGLPKKYGWWTTEQNKTRIVNRYNALIRDHGYAEYDQEAVDEADVLEHKEDGTIGAVDGSHDDVFMSSAIGLWMATSEFGMEDVKIVTLHQSRKPKKATMAKF